MLNKILNTSGKRRLFGNFLSLMVLRGFDYVVPLITLPYTIRVVGLANYGILALGLSLATYFGALIQYGFTVTAVRDIAKNRDNASELCRIYSTTATATLTLAVVNCIAFTCLIIATPKFNQHAEIYFFSFFLISMQALFPVWFFQGMEKMRYITYINLLSRLILVSGLFIFVTEESDYPLVPLISALATLTSVVAATLIIRYHFKLIFIFPEWQRLKQAFIDGRHAFISQLAPNLYNNSSTFLLGYFFPSQVVGSFSAATRLIDIFNAPAYIISNTFLPYLSRNIKKHVAFQKIMVTASLSLTLLLFVFSNELVSLIFSSENIEVSRYVRYLAASVFFSSLFLTYSTNYLIIAGHEKVAKNIALFTSVSFFLIGLATIPLFGILGSITTLVGARFVMGFLSYLYYRKDFARQKH